MKLRKTFFFFLRFFFFSDLVQDCRVMLLWLRKESSPLISKLLLSLLLSFPYSSLGGTVSHIWNCRDWKYCTPREAIPVNKADEVDRAPASHSPRSEHWTTRRWHWQRKGQTGPIGSNSGTSRKRSSGPIPEASSSSIKSNKPFCWNGPAQETCATKKKIIVAFMISLEYFHNQGTWEISGRFRRVALPSVCLT